jgi:hypothetical protein
MGVELLIPGQVDRVEWKPNPKQALFLSIPWSIKEALYGGGAGSGKSDLLLMYGIVHRLYLNPRYKQVLMRRTHADLKKEIVPRSRDIYPKFGATFNGTDMIWTFPRPDQYGSGMRNAGATIHLGHCENEKDVHNYDSMEISVFSPDEVTLLTEYIYLYVGFERTRAPKGSGLPSVIRGAGMPGGIGHSFIKRRLIDPYKPGGKIIVGKGGNKRIYIHSTQKDNKDHIDPTYEQSLQGRPEAERKAKLEGDWDAYLGLVFEEFRDKRYHDEPENALHVIEPFDIPSWWPRIVVGDWGYAAMCWIGFAAISPTKRVYVYRELYWFKTDIEIWAPIVKDFIDKEHPRMVQFCQSAGQHKGDHTIQEQIETALGRPIDLTTNSAGSRVSGKMLLHEYLRWKPRPIIPPDEMPVYDEARASWLLRNKGLEEYKAYLSIFDPVEPETNIPKLQIFRCAEDQHDGHPNCCPMLIEAIKAANYDDKKEDKAAEDVKEFNGDDPYDGIRYICKAADQYFETAADEFKMIQQQAAIIAKLENDKDFTAFYRNQRTLESSNQSMMVRRFHKGKRR